MARRHLPDPDIFIGLRLKNSSTVIANYHKSGRNALLFEPYLDFAGQRRKVACKAIPLENLRDGWDSEILKPHLLPQGIRVVRPSHYETLLVPENSTDAYVIILMDWIDGNNLRDYLEDNRRSITAEFCLGLGKEMLVFLHAMKQRGIQHSDIHAGNILIEKPDPAYLDGLENIWLTDFGIGGSMNDLTPKDDFLESSRVISEALDVALTNTHSGESRYIVDKLQEWLVPRLLETNVSSPHYRNTLEFNDFIDKIYRALQQPREAVQLSNPFDYMSCEHIGDQFELLQTLYAYDFPNRAGFLERTNSVLTGPRGCGKTMIFRSLSTKAEVLGKRKPTFPLKYFGIYYNCTDLYFAFPSIRKELSDDQMLWVVNYFNMAIVANILDSLDAISEVDENYSITGKEEFILFEFLKSYIHELRNPITGMNIMSHLHKVVDNERLRSKRGFSNGQRLPIDEYTGLDFLIKFAQFIQETIGWLKAVPLMIFIDDYSTPRITMYLQATLNRIIFQRSAEILFKVSTESIITFHPYDSDKKLLEIGREYDLIDLGASFLHTSFDIRSKFIQEIVDKRLINAKEYQLPKIKTLLGDKKISFNEMARLIRENNQYEFHGYSTYVNICSGDITNILSVARDILRESGGLEQFRRGREQPTLPLPNAIQHKAIREIGVNFLNNIQSAPVNGPLIRRIADAFGRVAGWELLNLNSKNIEGNPPKQAFRIEVREMPVFEGDDKELEEIYNDLLRYGVFFRDVRGKSQRGVIVPRLYLRRLLIPSYRLTFSKRDNVGMEVKEFLRMLKTPEEFVEARISRLSKKKEEKNQKQADMF